MWHHARVHSHSLHWYTHGWITPHFTVLSKNWTTESAPQWVPHWLNNSTTCNQLRQQLDAKWVHSPYLQLQLTENCLLGVQVIVWKSVCRLFQTIKYSSVEFRAKHKGDWTRSCKCTSKCVKESIRVTLPGWPPGWLNLMQFLYRSTSLPDQKSSFQLQTFWIGYEWGKSSTWQPPTREEY